MIIVSCKLVVAQIEPGKEIEALSALSVEPQFKKNVYKLQISFEVI